MDRITDLESRDPKLFWKLIKDLKSSKQMCNDIDIQTWETYFKTLHSHDSTSNKNDQGFEQKVDDLV